MTCYSDFTNCVNMSVINIQLYTTVHVFTVQVLNLLLSVDTLESPIFQDEELTLSLTAHQVYTLVLNYSKLMVTTCTYCTCIYLLLMLLLSPTLSRCTHDHYMAINGCHCHFLCSMDETCSTQWRMVPGNEGEGTMLLYTCTVYGSNSCTCIIWYFSGSSCIHGCCSVCRCCWLHICICCKCRECHSRTDQLCLCKSHDYKHQYVHFVFLVIRVKIQLILFLVSLCFYSR